MPHVDCILTTSILIFMDGTYTMVMNNKIRLSVTALLFLFASVIQAETTKPNLWEEAIAQFEQQDREQFPPGNAILFVGSSSIKMWKTLAEDFAPLTVINRGFGGSRIEDSIHFADRIIIPYRPSAIVLYAGDNDIAAGKTPETVFRDFRRFTEVVRAGLPQTPVLFLSIKPSPSRWTMWRDMKKANGLIEQYSRSREGIEFIDVSTPMLDENGVVRPELFLDDKLHINADGYRLWTTIIRPRLDALSLTRKRK